MGALDDEHDVSSTMANTIIPKYFAFFILHKANLLFYLKYGLVNNCEQVYPLLFNHYLGSRHCEERSNLKTNTLFYLVLAQFFKSMCPFLSSTLFTSRAKAWQSSGLFALGIVAKSPQ